MSRLCYFVIALFTLCISLEATAGEYYVTTLGTGDSGWYSDLVTDAYCAKYPVKKYKIVVLNEANTNNLAAWAYAVAFVSPRYHDDDQIKPITTRYYSHRMDTGNRTIGNAEELRYQASRDAVENLMSTIK